MTIAVPGISEHAQSPVGAGLPLAPAFFTSALPNSRLFDTPTDGLIPAPPSYITLPNPRRQIASAGTMNSHDNYFERVYVAPDKIEAGAIVSTTTIPLEVFNAFRNSQVSWTTYDDSTAGAGVSLANPPPPPPTIVIEALFSTIHDLVLDVEGDAAVDGELVFSFTSDAGPVTVSIPITASRSTLFPFRPEQPFPEDIEFFTIVERVRNGQEQRSSMRQFPRTIFSPTYKVDAVDRAKMDAIFYAGQASQQGVGLHFEHTETTANITAGDTVIPVNDATFGRFRVGGLVAVWRDTNTFETIQIDAVAANSITTSTQFTGSFAAGSLVMPVALSTAQKEIGHKRFDAVGEDGELTSFHEKQVEFTITSDPVDLADVSGFSSYTPPGGATRVYLDDDNFLSGKSLSEAWSRPYALIDNKQAPFAIFSKQEVSRLRSSKGFFTRSKQQLKDLRGLLYHTRGRAVAFYMASFSTDLALAADLDSADQAIQVQDTGFFSKMASRNAIQDFRIVLKDETVLGPFRITGASAPVGGVEAISIAPEAIGVNVPATDVDRVEFVRRVRFDTDRFRILHQNAAGRATMYAPVVDDLNGDD